MATQNNLAKRSVSVSDLAKDPLAAVAQGEGFAVAVFNHNQPVFYCVPARAYEALMDYMDELELAVLVMKRNELPELVADINTL